VPIERAVLVDARTEVLIGIWYVVRVGFRQVWHTVWVLVCRGRVTERTAPGAPHLAWSFYLKLNVSWMRFPHTGGTIGTFAKMQSIRYGRGCGFFISHTARCSRGVLVPCDCYDSSTPSC